MCGIVGVAALRPVAKRAWLEAGRDALGHRGPDDKGAWWSSDGRVGLGHRRLSIVDLSPAGHQPMHNGDGDLTIVFNGEIYNFRELREQLQARGYTFRSRTDTEVILAAYREWGMECLSRFNGMAAFALYDAALQILFLARDRAGEKPLFYTHSTGSLHFASEVKGLLADASLPRRIDPEALDLYLAIGYVPAARCMVAGINKLPPAHAMSFDLNSGELRVWRYWQPPEPVAPDATDDGSLLQELEELLADAVARQLEADVPVGVLLSGGVDSSLVTAMAVRTSRQVRTFTVGFENFGDYDESPHARLIANHFGTRHTELKADDIAPDLLLELARQYDEPMLDSSMIPTYLVSRLVREHCTVALGGDGGDELFGGYAHYNRLLWTQARLGWLPRPIGVGVAAAARVLLPTGFRGRNWLQTLHCDFRHELPLIATFFDAAERRRLMRSAVPQGWRTDAESIWRSLVPRVDSLLERVSRMEFGTYMAEDILVKVDRASMLNSLEVRAPLLDYRILEFAFGRVPARLKATPDLRKILLKRLAAKLLPPQFDQQRKQGFSVPLASWLESGPWRQFFRDVLLDPGCLFAHEAVATCLRGQERGMYNQERLFGLVLFELWRREYRMAL